MSDSSSPPVSERLFQAALSVVDGALAVVPGEHVVVVVDAASRDFGRALEKAIAFFHATSETFVLEDFGERPHDDLHEKLREAVDRADASVMNIAFHPGEFPMRAEFVDLAAYGKLRHAHMVGVSRASLLAGLIAEPASIARLSRALRVRILPTSTVHVFSAAGTDLTVRFERWCKWYETSGVIQPGTKANLPAGELVTCPASVDGVYVADGSLADASGGLTRDLASGPVRLQFEGARIRDAQADDDALAARILAHVCRTENLDRVGLVNFGTNLGMTEPAEDIFTSQKLPGFHLSLGLSFPQRTGASWNAMDWIAFTSRRNAIDIDGQPVMRDGRYLV